MEHTENCCGTLVPFFSSEGQYEWAIISEKGMKWIRKRIILGQPCSTVMMTCVELFVHWYICYLPRVQFSWFFYWYIKTTQSILLLLFIFYFFFSFRLFWAIGCATLIQMSTYVWVISLIQLNFPQFFPSWRHATDLVIPFMTTDYIIILRNNMLDESIRKTFVANKISIAEVIVIVC